MRHLRQVPILAATALVALFVFLFFYAGVAPAPSGSPGPLDKTLFQADEEEKIRAGLRDPESARFRNEFMSANPEGPALCGQVNFKNGMGGYEGFERFISGPPTLPAPLIEGAIGAGEMDRQWPKFCEHRQ